MDRSTLLSLFTVIGGLGGIAGIVYLYSTVFKPGNLRITVASSGRKAQENLKRSGANSFEIHIPVMIQNTGARPISIHAMNWTLNKPDWLPLKVSSVPQFANDMDSFVLEPKRMLSSSIALSLDLRGSRKGRDADAASLDKLEEFRGSHRERISLQLGCDIIGKHRLLHKRKSHRMQKNYDITKQIKVNMFADETQKS